MILSSDSWLFSVACIPSVFTWLQNDRIIYICTEIHVFIHLSVCPFHKYLMTSYHTYNCGYLNSHVNWNKNKFLCTIHLQNRHQQSREKFPFLALCILLMIVKMKLVFYFTSQSLNTVSQPVVSDSLRPHESQHAMSITNSQSLLKLMPIESVMPSSHLILCRPFLVLPPIPPSIRDFSNESALRMRWPKYWSFSFSISPSSEHPGLISFGLDWSDLLAVQGALKSLLQHHSSKSSIFWRSAFFTVQLSHPLNTVTLVISGDAGWWSNTWLKINCPILSHGSCVSLLDTQ